MACFAAYPNLENKSQKCAKSRDLWKNQESLGCTRSISCSLVGKSSEVSAMFVNLARNALFLFFAASKSSYHEYYMLLLLEGRFEGSSLKLKHPSRQRILLCWSPFAQEPQNLFVVFFWSHQAMLIGWSACFQIFAASLLFISASARTDLDLDTVTPASVFDNGFGNQCDMISCIALYRSDLVYQDLTSSFFSLEKSIWRDAMWHYVLRILLSSYIFHFLPRVHHETFSTPCGGLCQAACCAVYKVVKTWIVNATQCECKLR